MDRRKFIVALGIAFFIAAAVVVVVVPKKSPSPPAPSPKPHGEDLAAQIKMYESLVEKAPENSQHRARLGELLLKQGDRERGEQHLAKAAELDPGNAQLRIRLAMVYWHEGKTDKGIEQLDEALKVNPSLVDARFYKGILLSNFAGRKREGIAELKKVIADAPESRFAQQARRQLRKFQATEIPPFLPKAMGNLALKDYATGKEAIAEINKMHNKEIAIANGYVGNYADSKGTKSAKLWISESEDPDDMLRRMLAGIEKEDTPFSDPKEVEGIGTEVHSLEGMGQRHYIWARENLLIWLSLKDFSVDEALQFIQEAIQVIGTG